MSDLIDPFRWLVQFVIMNDGWMDEDKDLSSSVDRGSPDGMGKPAHSPAIDWSEDRPLPEANQLILLLHGMNCSPQTLRGLIDRIAERQPHAELMIPKIPLRWNQFLDLEVVVEEIAQRVSSRLEQPGIQSLVLIGHSAGGVIAQAVYLSLQTLQVPVRLVLIAPLSRGWTLSHHLPFSQKIAWMMGIQLARVLNGIEKIRSGVLRRKARSLWIQSLRRGAPFIVNLRLRWLERARSWKQTPHARPSIYLLLGSSDEIISWRDMVDEVIHSTSRYFQIPYSNHANIVEITQPVSMDSKSEEQARIRKQREQILLDAIFGHPEQTEPSYDFNPYDLAPTEPDEKVKRVVFVMHGIRDEGHWTQKIAAQARNCFRNAYPEAQYPDDRIAVETSSYGYFSIFEFMNPAARQQKIHWLMDEYVEARRMYPNAEFSYIGHSNGTYLIAKALLDYDMVRFDRLAFAGSVVSCRYPWKKLIAAKRVNHVVNVPASNDYVVGFTTRWLDAIPCVQRWIQSNLGGAGVGAFADFQEPQTFYAVGGHGAAVEEWNWKNLANFAVAPAPVPTIEEFRREAPRFVEKTHWALNPQILFLALVPVMLCFGFLAYLGFLAVLNPWLFWGGTGLVLALGFGIMAATQSRADGASFETRKRMEKHANWMFGATFGLSIIWLLSPFVGLYGFWEGFALTQGQDWTTVLRTCSLLAYLKGLFNLLMRV